MPHPGRPPDSGLTRRQRQHIRAAGEVPAPAPASAAPYQTDAAPSPGSAPQQSPAPPFDTRMAALTLHATPIWGPPSTAVDRTEPLDEDPDVRMLQQQEYDNGGSDPYGKGFF